MTRNTMNGRRSRGPATTTRELIELAAHVRALEDDEAYTLYLHFQRLAAKYKERGSRGEARFCAKVAALLDARYAEAVAA